MGWIIGGVAAVVIVFVAGGLGLYFALKNPSGSPIGDGMTDADVSARVAQESEEKQAADGRGGGAAVTTYNSDTGGYSVIMKRLVQKLKLPNSPLEITLSGGGPGTPGIGSTEAFQVLHGQFPASETRSTEEQLGQIAKSLSITARLSVRVR